RKTYGDALGFAGTEFSTGAGQLVNGDTVTGVSLTSAGAAAAATYTTPGPDYAIVAGDAAGNGLGNYAISYVNGNLHVSQRGLTGGVTAADKLYDGNTSATIVDHTLAGVVNGDSVSYVGGTAAF